MKYRLSTDDNFHYTDESERSDAGTYETMEEALAAARAIVDKSLRHLYQPGFTPEILYDYYTDFGNDPFIVSDHVGSSFSAWNYAKGRCAAICAEMAGNPL